MYYHLVKFVIFDLGFHLMKCCVRVPLKKNQGATFDMKLIVFLTLNFQKVYIFQVFKNKIGQAQNFIKDC